MLPAQGRPSAFTQKQPDQALQRQGRGLPLGLAAFIFIAAILTTYTIASQGHSGGECDTYYPSATRDKHQNEVPIQDAMAKSKIVNKVLEPAQASNSESPFVADKVTVVLMSYPGSDRFHLLEKIIKRALQWPFVYEVLLVWNGDVSLVPLQIKELSAGVEHPGDKQHGIDHRDDQRSPELTILPQKLNRVDNRWRIGERVRTEAVLNMDDDIDLRTNGAQCLFDVWQASPDALVCLDVRSHYVHKEKSGKSEGPFGLYGYAARDTSTKDVKKFSICLPRSLLTSRKHFLAYDAAWRDESTQVKRIVDELLCDDIAFNFVANQGHNVPLSIYAKANYEPYAESNSDKAMVKKPGMKAKRQRCVNELAAALNMTLKHRYWHVVCSVDG